jgi:hypothetical protein
MAGGYRRCSTEGGRDHTAKVEDMLRCGSDRREIVGRVSLKQDRQVGQTHCLVRVWHSAMLLRGLGSAEVRGLFLKEVDQGRRRVRVVSQGGREGAVPVDAAFFAELNASLRYERPPVLATAGYFVVLRGPSTGAPVTEAVLRSLFRLHRSSSGANRFRPHRLRHTCGTEQFRPRDRPACPTRADGTTLVRKPPPVRQSNRRPLSTSRPRC